mgnify:FL=1
MITAFLLAPVLAILMWLYAYLLPERGTLRLFDYPLLTIVIVIAAVYVHFAMQLNWHNAGPLWPELVSVVGAYVILLGGLAAGLFWRRYNG